MEAIANITDQIINQVITSWQAQNKAVTRSFGRYEDNAYHRSVAPNRNSAIYLLGHLVAVNDAMLPLLGLGAKLYPELESIFITNPDVRSEATPSLATLKAYWENVSDTLDAHFRKMTIEDWLSRHNAVSAEDFALNPLRNKLAILLSRTTHESYHLGQINLLNAE